MYMKETFYFSHDYGARNDEKILKLIQKEGWEGYGIYWAIIEKLYEADGFLDEDYDCIAFDLRAECERIKRVINDYKLFTVASKKIHSKSCLARLTVRKGISEQNRQNAILRWNKRNKDNATALPPQSEGNASKVKESKVNIYKHFVPPTLEEVTSYCKERNNTVNPSKWLAHYEANGWLVGRNKMKNWKAAIRTWEHSDFNKNINSTKLNSALYE